MLKKVINAIEKYGMFDNTDTVTVALSGGADSVCLLYILIELKNKYGYKLGAVHINHMLRGEESNRDEQFVRSMCDRLSVPLRVERIDVGKIAEETGDSTELAARKVRYGFFEKIDGVVATAHTASDNLETAVYNFIRGTGIKGLLGVPPKRDRIARPLVFCTRKDVEKYLNDMGVGFVTDSTNLSDDYTRNMLRHRAVPVFKEINPSVEARVSNMCENLREDEDFLSQTARKIYILSAKDNELDAELLKIQHPAIIKRVISNFILEKCGYCPDSLHLNKCKDIVLSSGRVSMPKGLSVCCINGRFYIEENLEESFEYIVSLEEVNTLEEKVNNLLSKDIIDCDKISGSISFRTRQEGDTIRLVGRNCTKSLKKLYNEKKIPKEIRDKLPIAADENGVIWVFKVGVSERVAVDTDTKFAKRFIVTKNQ